MLKRYFLPLRLTNIKSLVTLFLLFTSGIFSLAYSQEWTNYSPQLLNRSKQLKGRANLFSKAIQFAQKGAEQYYLNSQLSDIAGCIEPGKKVMVYLNYQSHKYSGAGLSDLLVEVAPHPFSKAYIARPGIKYYQKAILVQGTGKYLFLGMHKYKDFKEYKQLTHGKTIMYARPKTTAQSYWGSYYQQLKAWKETNKDKIKALDKQPKYKPVRSDFIRLDKVKPDDLLFIPFQAIDLPKESEEKGIDINLRGLINDFHRLEEDIIKFEQDNSMESKKTGKDETKRFIDVHSRELKQLADILKVIFRTIHNYGYNEPYRILLEEWGDITKTLQPKTTKLIVEAKLMDRLRQRQNMRRQYVRQELKERPEVLRKRVWTYLKNAIDLACADTDRFERSFQYKKLPGVKLSAADFERFYTPDRAKETKISNLLKVRIEDRPLSSCQRHILDRMQKMGRPANVLWVADKSRKYREENPGLLKSLVIMADEASNAIDEFFQTIGEAFTIDTGRTASSYMGEYSRDGVSGGSSETTADVENQMKGMTSVSGSINISRPDFDQGFGSTLGR